LKLDEEKKEEKRRKEETAGGKYDGLPYSMKTKARFSRVLRHPAWKQTGPILISALYKFVTYLLI